MTYKYYKFPNKESVPPINAWPKGVSISEIGIMTNNDAVYNDYGAQIQPPTPIEGWHINVCYQNNVNLDFVKQYEVQVNTPKRRWMGQ